MHQCRQKIHHDNAFCLAGASFAVIALPCNILFCAISQILIHSRPYSFYLQCLNCLLNSPSKLNIASVNREIIAVINSFVTHINERVKLLSCQPAEQSNYSRSAYQQELKKRRGWEVMWRKTPCTINTPSFRSSFSVLQCAGKPMHHTVIHMIHRQQGTLPGRTPP